MVKKNCKFCSEPIHPKRLEILPTADSCVKCSTTGKKAGITVTKGTGDHTYNEIVIMEPEEFDKYNQLVKNLGGVLFDDEVKKETPPDEGSSIDDVIDKTKF